MTSSTPALSLGQAFKYSTDAVMFQIRNWRIAVLFIAICCFVMAIFTYARFYTTLWLLDSQIAAQSFTIDFANDNLNYTLPIIGLLLFGGIYLVIASFIIMPWCKFSLTSRIGAADIPLFSWTKNFTRFLLTSIALTIMFVLIFGIFWLVLIGGLYYFLAPDFTPTAETIIGLTALGAVPLFVFMFFFWGYFLRLNLILPALTQTLEITLKDVLRYTKGRLLKFCLAGVIALVSAGAISLVLEWIIAPIAVLGLPVTASTITIIVMGIDLSVTFHEFGLVNFLSVFLAELPTAIALLFLATYLSFLAKHFIPSIAK